MRGSIKTCESCLSLPVLFYWPFKALPFCYLCFRFVFGMLSSLFLAALRSPGWKGLTYWLSGVWDFLVFCHFPTWCPGSGMVLDVSILAFFFTYWDFTSFTLQLNTTTDWLVPRNDTCRLPTKLYYIITMSWYTYLVHLGVILRYFLVYHFEV